MTLKYTCKDEIRKHLPVSCIENERQNDCV